MSKKSLEHEVIHGDMKMKDIAITVFQKRYGNK
jgi:hypothetical protein